MTAQKGSRPEYTRHAQEQSSCPVEDDQHKRSSMVFLEGLSHNTLFWHFIFLTAFLLIHYAFQFGVFMGLICGQIYMALCLSMGFLC